MRLRFGLLALLVSLPAIAHAQESSAVQTARAAVRALAAARGLAPSDLADLAPSDVVVDRRTGATFVYLVQRYNGVEVWATATPVAVDRTGTPVLSGTSAFEGGLAERANGPDPSVAAEAAVARAEAHVRGIAPAPYVVLTDDPATDAANLAARAVVYTATTPRLVYQPVEGLSLIHI